MNLVWGVLPPTQYRKSQWSLLRAVENIPEVKCLNSALFDRFKYNKKKNYNKIIQVKRTFFKHFVYKIKSLTVQYAQ